MLTFLLGSLLGLVQGMRHAFEPDHLAALSTILSDPRSAATRVRYAAAWGAGHALMLLAVGVVLLALRAEMPDGVARILDAVVGVMLVLLGVSALLRARRGAASAPGEHGHAHAHSSIGSPWRGLAVGVVHGLAGSGALAALAMAELPTVAAALAFIALFGLGALLGMALLASLLGAPLARVFRAGRAGVALLGLAGLFSIGLGVVAIGKVVVGG